MGHKTITLTYGEYTDLIEQNQELTKAVSKLEEGVPKLHIYVNGAWGLDYTPSSKDIITIEDIPEYHEILNKATEGLWSQMCDYKGKHDSFIEEIVKLSKERNALKLYLQVEAKNLDRIKEEIDQTKQRKFPWLAIGASVVINLAVIYLLK